MPPATSDHGCSSSSHQCVTTGSLVRPCSRPGLLVVFWPVRSSSGRARRRRSAPRCAPCAAAGRRSAVSLYDSDRSQRGWRRSHCVVEERLRVEVRLILQARGADGRDNGFHCGEENGFRALRPGTASGTTWSVGVRILPRSHDRRIFAAPAKEAAPAGRAAPPFWPKCTTSLGSRGMAFTASPSWCCSGR